MHVDIKSHSGASAFSAPYVCKLSKKGEERMCFFHKMNVIILGYNMKTSGCLVSQLLTPAIINIMKLSYDLHVSFFLVKSN